MSECVSSSKAFGVTSGAQLFGPMVAGPWNNLYPDVSHLNPISHDFSLGPGSVPNTEKLKHRIRSRIRRSRLRSPTHTHTHTQRERCPFPLHSFWRYSFQLWKSEGLFSHSLSQSTDGKSYAIQQECATLPFLRLSSTQERANLWESPARW